ncbi:tetratricopeptide repeat-containing sensor histidine kinase [Mucilaginibacter jinjuensis]|uniref:histidine kinase n=1 Tax=Mucilaginibacter jinjuensis TaxID=1176721 RepID=A0ABY7TBL6_9SPHI|nr:tetratricopeptide repeat-containing sensor histidine kinase [Mucilaginibacter jinjuensis]WCT13904.1 tetratricopeptide repeat-containing sensor histidine kinase [Mucilaginibacter jinjuensis]
MKYILTLLLICLYLTGNARVGNSSVDSLKKILTQNNKTPADTLTVNQLNKLADTYFQSNPDSTYYYGQKAVDLSRKIHYNSGLANGLLQTGHVDYFKGKSTEAQQELNEAIRIFKKLNDKKGLVACYQAFGAMYTLLADYPSAIKNLNLAIEINSQLGNNELMQTSLYKSMGNVYFSKGELSKSLDYYYKGLFIAIKNHYTIPAGNLYNNIGVVLQNMEVYPNAFDHFKKALEILGKTNNAQALGTINQNIGEILLAQNDLDGAIRYLNKANYIVKKQNDKDGLSSVYADLGLCYAAKNDFGKAISYIDTSLQIAQKYKMIYNQAYALIGLANVYNQQKDYQNAYKYATAGQQLSVKLGNLSVKANAALQLSKSLAGLGKAAQAYDFLNQYIDLKNQLKSNESIEKSTSYNFELTFALKEHQLKQQQYEKDLIYQQKAHSQRLTNVIFVVIILAMILISGVYYREKKKQQNINVMLEHKNHEVLNQKADLDEQAKKLNDLNTLKDRLISILAHDLRAPLSTLRGLFGLLQDDSITHQELVEMIPSVLKKLEYTSDFLDTLLFWINSQMENFDTSVKKFSVSELVQNEAEGNKEEAESKEINFLIDIPDGLTATADPNSIRIVVRNLITNAIKFSDRNDTIHVSAYQEAQKIIVKVADTGVGMSPDQLSKLFKSKVDSKNGTNNESGTGMGLLFCKDLIEKCNGEIWATSEPDVGTVFTFSIPVNC